MTLAHGRRLLSSQPALTVAHFAVEFPDLGTRISDLGLGTRISDLDRSFAEPSLTTNQHRGHRRDATGK
jgi:hypothetical protein